MKKIDLKDFLKGSNISFSKLLLAGILLFIQLSAFAQVRTISGTVTGTNNDPLIGVTVIAQGTSLGTLTDINGKFTLAVPANVKILRFSFIGMDPKELPITESDIYDIVLSQSVVGLEEVIVVGYGQQKKETVTGSISQINSEGLVQTPVPNISNALVGRATGVLAVQRSGQPGEDQSEIRIRGLSTFSGSQAPLILVDGIEVSNYNNIDPNEIENISILKDASSTAVYGVRGANGVVLISTKRGELGKPTIQFSSNIAGNTITTWRERLNAYDYTRNYEIANRYDSYVSGLYTQLFSDESMQKYKDHSDPIYFPDTNWEDFMLKDLSFQHQHNMNLRGGTEFVKYFISLGMLNQEGQFNNTNLQPDFFDMQSVFTRYNFRSNFDFNITKRLSARFNIADIIENRKGVNSDDVSYTIFRIIANANPVDTPGIVNGKFVDIDVSPTGQQANPLNAIYGGYRMDYRNSLEGSFRLDYDLGFITKGLKTHGTISFESYNSLIQVYSKARERYTAVRNQDNEVVLLKSWEDGAFGASSSSGKRRQSYAEFAINYARKFGKHNVTGLFLYNQQKWFNPSYQYKIPVGYQGLVGRITYDYGNKYLFEYNVGYNGNENFAPGKRFGYFPAYSLGWVLSEESFFPKNNILTFAKVRGSYGEVGNDKIGGDRFLYMPSSYTYPGTAYTWGEFGSSIASYVGVLEGKIGNPDVTWERAKKLNVGIELSFLKNKVKVIVDKFQEKRDNILMNPRSIPNVAGMGNNASAVNMGRMNNSGYDGEIQFSDNLNDFKYRIGANLTYATNIIVFRDEVPTPYPYLYETGQSYGQQFGYVSDGLYNTWEEVSDAYRPQWTMQNNYVQPGGISYVDVNGDGLIDQYDAAPIGYPEYPEINFGITMGGDYKGFDFSILLQGASNVTFIGSNRFIGGWGGFGSMVTYVPEKSWTQERYEQGLPIDFPHLFVMGQYSLGNQYGSNYYAEDASYVRLKNAEIGYRFAESLPIMKRLGVKIARVYLNGSNLLTWTYRGLNKRYPGLDPEQQSLFSENYPLIMVVNFGVSIEF